MITKKSTGISRITFVVWTIGSSIYYTLLLKYTLLFECIMVFGVATKYPLMNKFQLRMTPRNGETSVLTSSSFDSDVDDAQLIDAMNQSETLSRDGRIGAYDFNEFKEFVDTYRITQSMGMLPIPLPCIGTSTSSDIDDINDRMDDSNSQSKSTPVRFRWNSFRSQFASDKISDQENVAEDGDRTFLPFFTCGSSSMISPMMTDTQCNSMDGYNCSDDTSLLHGQTVHKASKFYKSALLTRPLQSANRQSATSSSLKKPNRSTNKDDNEQYESLIADQNATCHDWMNRQLAFDLEYLEDINVTSNVAENTYSNHDDEPNWTLHPDDINIGVPPPPPPIVRSKKSRKHGNSSSKGHMVSDDFFMKLIEEYESPTLLDELLQDKSAENLSKNGDTAVNSDLWQDFDAEIRIGYSSGRGKKSYRKVSPMVRTGRRFGRHNGTVRDVHQRSHTSMNGRRRSGRRSSPILLGRQFATNLSTVTERPSEEEANSTCIPTPMSARNRHFFSQCDSDASSSSQSGEGTAETCSSKDSSTRG